MSPRRILLLIILVALIAWNAWHYSHLRRNAAASTPAAEPAPAASGAWSAYDHAASLRDAPDTQFAPALASLRNATASMPAPNLKTNADTLADLRGCTTWLMFYRQSVNKPNPDPAWKMRSAQHLDSCTANHADIAR